jgi:hypothetical protein
VKIEEDNLFQCRGWLPIKKKILMMISKDKLENLNSVVKQTSQLF